MVDPVQKTPAQIADERLRELADKLWNDKTLGPQVQKFAKALYPDAKTTDDVVEPWVGPLREQNEALSKRLNDLLAERAEEKKASEQQSSEKSFRDMLDKVRKDYSLTDKGIDDVVARMKEAGAYDAEAAAAWVARQTPPPAAPGPTWAPQHLDLFGSRNKDEAFAQLHNDPQGYMDSQLSEFVRNPDQYVQDTFGTR
jgi:hypothetical protein